MSSYRPIESKREEFRKYLEKGGAMDAITKVLVMLYDEPDRPADPLGYIRQHLGENRMDDAELEIVKSDLEAATQKIQSLEDEIKVLKERLAQHETDGKVPMEEEAAPPEEVNANEASQPQPSSPAPSGAPAPAEPTVESAATSVENPPTQ